MLTRHAVSRRIHRGRGSPRACPAGRSRYHAWTRCDALRVVAPLAGLLAISPSGDSRDVTHSATPGCLSRRSRCRGHIDDPFRPDRTEDRALQYLRESMRGRSAGLPVDLRSRDHRAVAVLRKSAVYRSGRWNVCRVGDLYRQRPLMWREWWAPVGGTRHRVLCGCRTVGQEENVACTGLRGHVTSVCNGSRVASVVRPIRRG
jgi:hypothetical protein